MSHPAALAHAADASLRTIREHWGDLLLAIETPPADVWPPRQLAHTLRPGSDDPLEITERAPLVLRDHPAPLNLDALDTGIAIEEELFELADALAATVQHAPLDDLRRWAYRTERGPGSRTYGLHWAARYIAGRALNEDTQPELQLDGTYAPAPFAPLPEHLLCEAHRVATACERRLLRTLELDARSTPVPDRPCPWCTGQLTLHTSPDYPPTVTCDTGPDCTAPVLTNDHGHRIWEWRDLPDLVHALSAVDRRAEVNRRSTS